MAEITRAWHWESYRPDIGENRGLPRPFFFKIKAGLTKTELQALLEKFKELVSTKDASPAAVASVLGEVVQLGDEPLSLWGKKVETLADYFVATEEVSGSAPQFELIDALAYFNSLSGARELFSGRLSGGIVSTASPLSEPRIEKTDDR